MVLQFIKKPTSLQWANEMAALQMTMVCEEDHYHLPIEGSSPGIGNRARASGRYQQGFCDAIVDTVLRIYNDPLHYGDPHEQAFAEDERQERAARRHEAEQNEESETESMTNQIRW
eukprot:s223_g30.t1